MNIIEGAAAISGAGAFGLGVASSVLGKAGGNSVVNKDVIICI